MSVLTHTERKLNLSLPKLVAIAGILLTLAAPAIKGWRVYRAATALQVRIESIQTLADDGLGGLDANEIEKNLVGLRSEAQLLHGELEPLLPFTQWLTWLPRVGELMPVTPELLRLLDNGTLIAADLGVDLLPILPLLQDDSAEIEAKVPEILRIIDEADGSLETTADLWPSVYADLETILENPAARDALPWQVRQQLPTIEPLLPLVEKGIDTLRILPEIGALGGRRAYLIVGQNSDELRPTGGFLSMTMAVGIEDGRLRGTKISDANNVDVWQDKPYGDPPAAMREFMAIDLFLFRDSNFWPDFPTSSRKMIDFYTYGTGIELDGLIAFDIRFIGRFIEAIGPIDVPEAGITLTGDNTLEILEQAWAQGLAENALVDRKAFLGAIANGIFAHLQSDDFEPDIAQIATILDESGRDKSLQVYINGVEEKGAFAKMKLDGQVAYAEGEDLLMLIENNVGINKSSRLIETAIQYDVVLNAEGGGSADLLATWSHAGSSDSDVCEVGLFAYKAGLTYNEMVQTCNWNHIRLYTPATTDLVASSKYPIPADQMFTGDAWSGETRLITNDLSGFTVMENLILTPIGRASEFEVSYALDSVVTPLANGDQSYRLNLVRQAGVYPYPATEISITIPEGMAFVSASAEPETLTGRTLTFATVLNEDRFFEVVFR